MKVGDIVEVVTGCTDCGNVQAKVLDIIHDQAFVEVIGDLPHKASRREVWVDFKRIRSIEE